MVLAIIGLIATVAAPRLIETFGRAKSQTARIQLENVKAALQIFYLDTGRYPTEAEGLGALVDKPGVIENWQGPYLDIGNIVDPWGRQILYRYPGKVSEFELFTLGRDGQPGGSKEDSDINL